eukprot:evm.model.scf_1009.3 EVM.evm.TU.scf_1009.3   scf_1009:21032-25376(+)
MARGVLALAVLALVASSPATAFPWLWDGCDESPDSPMAGHMEPMEDRTVSFELMEMQEDGSAVSVSKWCADKSYNVTISYNLEEPTPEGEPEPPFPPGRHSMVLSSVGTFVQDDDDVDHVCDMGRKTNRMKALTHTIGWVPECADKVTFDVTSANSPSSAFYKSSFAFEKGDCECE